MQSNVPNLNLTPVGSSDLSATKHVNRIVNNIFAPDMSANQLLNDLKQQYENYTNLNKNVDSILSKVRLD